MTTRMDCELQMITIMTRLESLLTDVVAHGLNPYTSDSVKQRAHQIADEIHQYTRMVYQLELDPPL